jgi:DNA-binding MarR family transcriptional regulator
MANLRDAFDVLIRFETELWNSIDARLRADLDLPLARFEVMRVIGSHPGCRVFDIADELSITIGGSSKLVDRIEAAGHCRRRPNPGDRRSSIIEVTPAGQRILTKATKVFESELQARMGSAVSERALEQLYSTLTRLRAANAKADLAPPRA